MTNPEPRWTACPPGEIGRMASRLRGRKRRRVTPRAGGVLALLLLFVGLWSVRPGVRENCFAGLTCSRVIELAMAYGQGTLEPDLREKVKSHVDQCKRCHDRFKEMGFLARLLPAEWARTARFALAASRGVPDEHDRHGHAGSSPG